MDVEEEIKAIKRHLIRGTRAAYGLAEKAATESGDAHRIAESMKEAVSSARVRLDHMEPRLENVERIRHDARQELYDHKQVVDAKLVEIQRVLDETKRLHHEKLSEVQREVESKLVEIQKLKEDKKAEADVKKSEHVVHIARWKAIVAIATLVIPGVLALLFQFFGLKAPEQPARRHERQEQSAPAELEGH